MFPYQEFLILNIAYVFIVKLSLRSNLVFHHIPQDTGFKLDTLDVFWTSYIRLIYVLCPLSLCCLTLRKSILKLTGRKSYQKAEGAKLACMDFVC